MDYLMPNEEELKLSFLVNFGQEFLKLNSLKVGDIVEVDFPYQTLHSGYKSREMTTATWNRKEKGVLRLDDKGRLFAESLEPMDFYKWEYKDSKMKTGFYKNEKRKSIVKFGTGFLTW